MRLWQATRKLRMGGRNEREEVLLRDNPARENRRSGGDPASPVFLSQNKKGASIRDGDDLFLRPRKIRL